MPDLRRSNCRHCGAHRDDVGLISWAGYCATCGPKLMEANIDGLHTKTGVPWQRWRFGQARSLLGPDVANALYNAGAFRVPLDELTPDA